jgi:3-oxoacid CoA-transferase subunit A
VFRKTARNFSPMMCMAGKVTIVEAEQIVEPGELDGDLIHVPSIFVHRIIQSKNLKKWIERRTVRKQA